MRLREIRIEPWEDVICLNPGAAFGAAKYWPTDSFALLARIWSRSASESDRLCGTSERDQARNIARLANRPGVFSLADETLSLA